MLKEIESLERDADTYIEMVNELTTRDAEEVGSSSCFLIEDSWVVVTMGRFLKFLEFKVSGFKKQENRETESIKGGAIEVGIEISHLFVDVMLMLLLSDSKERVNVEASILALESDSGEDAPAINMIIALTGMAVQQLKVLEIRRWEALMGLFVEMH